MLSPLPDKVSCIIQKASKGEEHGKIRKSGTFPRRAGTEVVQLYLRDPHASMVRPNMELQGFARVALAPGESKTVTFTVSPSQMVFLNGKNERLIEKGKLTYW